MFPHLGSLDDRKLPKGAALVQLQLGSDDERYFMSQLHKFLKNVVLARFCVNEHGVDVIQMGVARQLQVEVICLKTDLPADVMAAITVAMQTAAATAPSARELQGYVPGGETEA